MSGLPSSSNLLTAPVTPGEYMPQVANVREWNNDLDRNAFLNLLMTQLRFQDPLNPMDDREFIAQMAQFTALEQMQQLNSAFNRFQAFNMIGQSVFGITRDSVTSQLREVSGRVDSVRVINNEPWLVIGRGANEQMLRARDVQFVLDDSLALTLTALMELNAGNVVSQNLGMVGRYIQAITDDGEGRATGFVEGKVEFVDFSGVPHGIPPMLVIGNERVHLGQIISVADGPMILGQTIGFYDDGAFVPNGVISEVRISGENAYLVINGATHAIDRINFVSEALRLYRTGAEVSHMGSSGQITQVFVNDGVVWTRINNGSPVQFADIMGPGVDSDD